LIGQLLYESLFTSNVKKFFDLVRGAANPNPDKRLRLELDLTGDDSLGLSSLPWEYLCYRDEKNDWKFLSTVAELVLTRYWQSNANAQKIVELKPNRIDVLLMVLNPDPKRLDDLATVERQVKDQLDKYKQALADQKIEVVVDHVGPPVTWERFEKKINELDCRPHILHLIAHGKFDEENKKGRSGKVAFHLTDEPEDIEVGIEGGNIDMITDKVFVNLFATANKLPRFAFLHMCEGGAIDKQDASAGVALCLAQEGVPAVVAMQHPIEIETSTVFSEVFYKALGEGQTIDGAVQLGRAKIAEKNAHNRAFGTPVLYLSTRSDFILPTVEKPARPGPDKRPRTLDSGIYEEHLSPIFKKYRADQKLTPEQMKPLVRQVKQLGCSFEELRSALEKQYSEYDEFDPIQEILMGLCNELSKKIKELAE